MLSYTPIYRHTHRYINKLCVYITSQMLMLTSTLTSHTAGRVSIYPTSPCVDISLFLYIFSVSKSSNYEFFKNINDLIYKYEILGLTSISSQEKYINTEHKK